MIELSLIIVSLVVLALAAYNDVRTLEVPDWLNYAGIFAGLGIHLIFSLQQWHWWPIASSIIGLAIGFALACLMFYTGQWGGGDAKLLMAIGALIGFQADKFGFGMSFLVNMMVIGAVWGFVWSIGLAIKKRKQFMNAFIKVRHIRPYRSMRLMSMLSAALLIVAAFIYIDFQIELLSLAIMSYVLCYATIFIKAVELSCMHVLITPDKLTEGDWLVKPVKVGKTVITPPKLGLDRKQVNLLKKLHKQKKLKNVLVKYGVPFTPAFLFAFIAVMLWNNIILTLFF